MFDDSIEFRFVTRTEFRDYRVFINGGRETLSNREGFRPLRQNAYLKENQPCAALFERSGKIYLLASSMSRNKVDERGRGIAFSFCWIFQQANLRQRARYAFIRLIENWTEAEEWISKNLHDIDNEGVELDEAAFCRWLLSDCKINSQAQFKRCQNEAVSIEGFTTNYLWPAQEHIFRYEIGDDCIEHLDIGKEEDITDMRTIQTEESPRSRAKKIIAGFGAAALIGISIGYGCYVVGRDSRNSEIKELQAKINNMQNKFDESIVLSQDDINEIAKTCAGDILAIIRSHDIDPRSADYVSGDIRDSIVKTISEHQEKNSR